MLAGLCSEELFPSPKSQFHFAAFSERSVNCTVSGAFPDVVLLLKAAAGNTGSRTVIAEELELVPLELLIVSVAVYSPAAE